MFKSLFKCVFKPGLRKFSNRSLPDVEIPPKPPLTSHMIQQALRGPWGPLALSQWFLNSNNPWWLIIAVVSLQAWQRNIYYLMILPYIYINLQLYRIFNCQVWLLKSKSYSYPIVYPNCISELYIPKKIPIVVGSTSIFPITVIYTGHFQLYRAVQLPFAGHCEQDLVRAKEA